MGCCWTPHEENVEKGLLCISDDGNIKNSRVNKMLAHILDQPPRVAVDRAKWFTRSFQETEGMSNDLRWAAALKKCAENLPVLIDGEELIVGRIGQGTRYALIYPELRGAWLPNLAKVADREGGKFYLSPEDCQCVMEEIVPYWTGRTWHEGYYSQLPEETRRVIWEEGDPYACRGVVNALTTQDSALVWALDYEKILKKGILGLKREMEARLAEVDVLHIPNEMYKRSFYQAAIVTCDAIVCWAERYAAEAERMAGECQEPGRREELEEIARICRRVPAHPAESFYEAVQCVWFANAFSRLEQIMAGQMGLGRIDQYLYPYYKADKDKGILTEERTLELLECLWLNLSRIRRLVPTSSISNYQGYPHFEQACLGGQTPDGRDASNELSYLILQSKKEFPLDFPDMSVRIHSMTPAPFLQKTVEVIKEGTGFPKLYNDEDIVPMFLYKGATYAEALDYTGCGCAEVRLINRETYMTQGSQLNIPSAVEMALRDGFMLRVSRPGERIGLPTGDPRQFKTWEEFWNAFLAQMENMFRHAFINRSVGDLTKVRYLAAPFQSMLHDLCVEQALDIHMGQGKFKNDISLGNLFVIGVGTTIDSLAAIKKLVFDDKAVSMDELIKALDADFEGYEVLRQKCLHCPKYGNADPYADDIGRAVDLAMNRMTSSFRNPWGGTDNICLVPTSVVSVDINPSIQLEVNRFDRVIRVQEYNESGRELIQELKLWYLDCGEAVEKILESGSISALLAEDGRMEITVAGRPAQCSRLLEAMETCTAGHENVRCYRAEPEYIQNAQALGLSMGKYRALLDLQALDPQITAEDIRDLTMAQIRQLERELSGEEEAGGCGPGYGGGGGNGCGRGGQ